MAVTNGGSHRTHGFVRVLIRWFVALISVAIGWFVQLGLHHLIFTHASEYDTLIWEIWTGVYCGVAWVLIGFPLAINNPSFPSLGSKLKAVFFAGLAGAGIALLGPALIMYFVTGPLAFIVGCISMAAYLSIMRFVASSLLPAQL